MVIATRKVKQESGKAFLESARKAGRDALLAGAPLVQLPSRFSCFFSLGVACILFNPPPPPPPPPHHVKVDHINSNQDSTGHTNKFIHIKLTNYHSPSQPVFTDPSSHILRPSIGTSGSYSYFHNLLFNLHILFLYFNNLFCAI